jgi:hypothetical protein
MRDYPEDYKGPKAGRSSNEEWLAVTEFQAFKFMKDCTWYYSDFDCWLAARDKFHYTKGGDDSVKAFKEAYKIMGISSFEL